MSGSNYCARHVSFFDWFLPRIEASLRLPCTFPIKTTPFFSHFSAFLKNTLSEHVRHICQRSVRSIPAYFVLICSLLGLVSNSFLFLRFISIFILSLKTLLFGFCALSPFTNPLVLGSVTTCRQCLVHQVTNCSSMTRRVMKTCTHRVIKIQMI